VADASGAVVLAAPMSDCLRIQVKLKFWISGRSSWPHTFIRFILDEHKRYKDWTNHVKIKMKLCPIVIEFEVLNLRFSASLSEGVQHPERAEL
jgi:hypothetical protein